MKKNKKNIRSPYFLYTILITLILGILTVVFLIPQVAKLVELYRQNEKEKLMLVKYQEKLTDLKNLKENELAEKNSLLLRAMPSSADVVYYIASLNQIAQESNVIIDEIQMQNIKERMATESAKSVSGAGISVKMSGDLSILKAFIGKINSFLPIFSIQIINYDTSINGFNVTLAINSVRFPESIGKIDDPLVKITPEEEALIERLKNYTSLNNVMFEIEAPTGKDNPFIQ